MAGEHPQAADSLEHYRSIRDFERTPEPTGREEPEGDGARRFVVQEHHATALHWDVRLERDGVLVSWAVPKGVPPDPRENHLAVHTEDHPLSYLDFEGEIPKGEYGGGRMIVWDRGTYECEKWDDREVIVSFAGTRVRGRYVLFHTDGKQWMMHRLDPPDDPGRERLPAKLRPLALVAAPMPEDEHEWSFEPAWGGHRVVVSSEGGRARAADEHGDEVGDLYPELRDLGRALGAVEVALEGEMVVTGPEGRPDPGGLLRRREARTEAALRRMADRAPAAFFADDILWLEGHSTAGLPGRQRRLLLEKLELSGPRWGASPTRIGDGSTLLTAARAQGLAGVVARRLEGAYEAGSVLFVPI